jgi:hypothetical protein
MKTEDGDVNTKMQVGSPLSRFTWLIVGVGIGAVTGIPLPPRSGENTREWFSAKCKHGMGVVNFKMRHTGQQVGERINRGQHQVRKAVIAGRDAFNKAKWETSSKRSVACRESGLRGMSDGLKPLDQ